MTVPDDELFLSSVLLAESEGLVHREDPLSLSAESLLFDEDGTTYGKAAWLRAEAFFPFRVPVSWSLPVLCWGITIFSGGTLGPLLPKLSPLLFSSVSPSLSFDLLLGFGLGHGLFRSRFAAILVDRQIFLFAPPDNLDPFSGRCGVFRLDWAVDFDDDEVDASFETESPSLRFLRLTSSSTELPAVSSLLSRSE